MPNFQVILLPTMHFMSYISTMNTPNIALIYIYSRVLIKPKKCRCRTRLFETFLKLRDLKARNLQYVPCSRLRDQNIYGCKCTHQFGALASTITWKNTHIRQRLLGFLSQLVYFQLKSSSSKKNVYSESCFIIVII